MTRKFARLMAPLAGALAIAAMPSTASATETSFANFTGLGISLIGINSGVPTGSLVLADSTIVNFGFLKTDLSQAINGIQANLVFTASSLNSNFDVVSAQKGVAHQAGFGGTLSILSINPLTVFGKTYAPGANLLSATFSNAALTGIFGQQNAGFSADKSDGGLVYTSDFLKFTTIAADYSLSFGAITPFLAAGKIGGQPAYIDTFTATPTGSFASDQIPAVVIPVPEPASWAFMLVGLGSIGAWLRLRVRRRLLAA